MTLDEELISAPKQKFEELGTPMKEMWGLVIPEDMLHGFGEKQTMTKLKKLLQSQTTEPLAKKDRSWACGALDKALNPQQMKLRLSSTAHLNDRVQLPAEQSEDELSDTPDDLHSRSVARLLSPAPRSLLDLVSMALALTILVCHVLIPVSSSPEPAERRGQCPVRREYIKEYMDFKFYDHGQHVNNTSTNSHKIDTLLDILSNY